MVTFSPQYLAKTTQGEWKGCRPQAIRGFAIDTRRLRPGELFVALETPCRDGHHFLPEAFARGAAGALVRRVNTLVTLPQLIVGDPFKALERIASCHRQSFVHPVVGITGSCGKTSTKDLLALLLDDEVVCRTSANENNHLGVPLSLLRITPDRHRYAVIEAGVSAPGEMAPLASLIAPDAAVITGLAPAHLQGFGDMATLAREKAILARYARMSGWVGFPAACLRYPAFHDLTAETWVLMPEGGDELASQLPNQQKVRQVRYRTQMGSGASRIVLEVPDSGRYCFTAPVCGPGMLNNTALALTLALGFGIPESVLQERLLRWQPGALRGQLLHRDGKMIYLDCYNANPASLAECLAAFVCMVPRDLPRLYILGGMDELGEQATW